MRGAEGAEPAAEGEVPPAGGGGPPAQDGLPRLHCRRRGPARRDGDVVHPGPGPIQLQGGTELEFNGTKEGDLLEQRNPVLG